MKTIDENYQPYGVEWKNELMKLPKIHIISLYRMVCLAMEECNEKPLNMPTRDETDAWADKCAINTTTNKDTGPLIKAALYLGTEFMRTEIEKRNGKTKSHREN